ncbi:anionic trypsin-2-like [Xiphophorus maculatus]|uniref:anionic trypsin-2-like n=1 Tax=Xiphophorus maculatus TaxID=8083 RepID=UPI000C6CE7D1|nr:anionic trypsin-2-like [Xiphophorus maculatus]
MALLKVLLLLGLGVSVNSDVSLQKRIIGGQNCPDTERLYHVRLENIKGNEKIRCGGSLIHPQWILTAAHCWKLEPGWTNIAVLKVHPRTVMLQYRVIRPTPVIYDPGHDIMLLKLQTPVTDVPVARLPDCSYRLKAFDTVQLAGEGATTTGPNNQRSHLQCVNMKVVGVSLFKHSHGFIFHAEAPNKDVCYGDTGGAAMYNDKIYGVISFGEERYACQRPASILDVCEYKRWIRRRTGLQ